MDDSVRVQSIEGLEAFRDALDTYGNEMRGTLQAIDTEIGRTLDMLRERRNSCQRDLQKSRDLVGREQASVATASAAAAATVATAAVSAAAAVPGVGLVAAVAALNAARKRQQEAEERLRQVEQQLARVETAAVSYKKQASQFMNDLDSSLPRGSGQLAREVALLTSLPS